MVFAIDELEEEGEGVMTMSGKMLKKKRKKEKLLNWWILIALLPTLRTMHLAVIWRKMTVAVNGWTLMMMRMRRRRRGAMKGSN
jgi:hypothetical protein